MADELNLIVSPGPEVVVQVNDEPTPEVIVASVITQGGANSIGALADVDTSAKLSGSLLYYDAATEKFKADATVTTTTITDGGSY